MCSQADKARKCADEAALAAKAAFHFVVCNAPSGETPTHTYTIIPNTFTRISQQSVAKNASGGNKAPACATYRHWSRLWTLLVVALFIWDNCIGCVSATPESCVLCEANDLYLFDHRVTRQDAISSLRNLSDGFFAGEMTDHLCLGATCNKEVMKYCLGSYFIKDHCWCEQQHSVESLPFVPHICYVSDKYTPAASTCFEYYQLLQCCCAPALARQFRYLAGAACAANSNVIWLVIMLLAPLLARICRLKL